MRKYLYGVASFVLAFVILSVSVVRSAAVSYGYSAPTPTTKIVPTPTPTINYFLPYPGKILPDNWLWYFKAIRDKSQYLITTDPLKKADLALLYSDKRLGGSVTLFENKKPDIAASTLTKGEKYLEEAVKDEEIAKDRGINTNDFLIKLANASLRHRQVIEEQILPLTPEDMKPVVIKSEDYAKNVYKTCRDALNSASITLPKDPFNGQ
ncbi:MAG TPA: DUF5667 domain-containing protein [Patescibacteria group bacterium]|nr:DUF5667 domain-containing protein [Patescibacteria group bacterium]